MATRDRASGVSNGALSAKVLSSLRALNESLLDVRASVAKIDNIASSRLAASATASGLSASFLAATRQQLANSAAKIARIAPPSPPASTTKLSLTALSQTPTKGATDTASKQEALRAKGIEVPQDILRDAIASTHGLINDDDSEDEKKSGGISPHSARTHTPPPSEFLHRAHPHSHGSHGSGAGAHASSSASHAHSHTKGELHKRVSFARMSAAEIAAATADVDSVPSPAAVVAAALNANYDSDAEEAKKEKKPKKGILHHTQTNNSDTTATPSTPSSADEDESFGGAQRRSRQAANSSAIKKSHSNLSGGVSEGEEDQALGRFSQQEAADADDHGSFDSDDEDTSPRDINADLASVEQKLNPSSSSASASSSSANAIKASQAVSAAATAERKKAGIAAVSSSSSALQQQEANHTATEDVAGLSDSDGEEEEVAPRGSPVRFVFRRFKENPHGAAGVELEAAAVADNEDDDDHHHEDIPYSAIEIPISSFYASEDEAAELKKVKEHLKALKKSGSGGVGETAEADQDAEADNGDEEVEDEDEDGYVIFDDTPEPRIKDKWNSGDATWPTIMGDSKNNGAATAVAMGSKPHRRFEAFNLKVVYEAGKTGFEESKEFNAPVGSIIAGRYKVVDFLGSGAFSTALACRDLVLGIDVCVKVIKNDKEFVDQAIDEIKLLRYINYEQLEEVQQKRKKKDKKGGDSSRVTDDGSNHNLLRLYEYFYTREHLFIVVELLKDNLYEFQKYLSDGGHPNYFTLPRIQRIAKQVLNALSFLSSKAILHSDLKPENILLSSYSRCEVKVIDLGSSCFTSDHLSSYIQSRSYRAPEVILGLPYSPKIDVYSLGCILCELLTGQVLFPNESVATILCRMQSLIGPFPKRMLEEGVEASKYITTKGDQVYERTEEGTIM
jgi:Protein kinase domain